MRYPTMLFAAALAGVAAFSAPQARADDDDDRRIRVYRAPAASDHLGRPIDPRYLGRRDVYLYGEERWDDDDDERRGWKQRRGHGYGYRGRDPSYGYGYGGRDGIVFSVGGYFDSRHSWAVEEYFGGQYRRYADCRDDWRRPYAVGYALPPNLVIYAAPDRLIRRLPPPPYGARYGVVDRDIVLVADVSRLVIDAIVLR